MNKMYSFGGQDPIFRKEVGEYKTIAEQLSIKEEYDLRAAYIVKKHLSQTEENVYQLRSKYSEPIFGSVYVYDMLEKLSECVDPTDTELYCTNQLIHSLQVAEGMEKDNITDEHLILTALIHDIGKLIALVGEFPENIHGPNEPIQINKGLGLENTLMTWNHDEFAYSRLSSYLPDSVAWLVRYHSLRFDLALQCMNDKDNYYYRNFLGLFRMYDLKTKSIFHIPNNNLCAYKFLIEKYFPEKIAF